MKKADSEKLIADYKSESSSIVNRADNIANDINMAEKYLNEEKEYINENFAPHLNDNVSFLPKDTNQFLFADNLQNGRDKFEYQYRAIIEAKFHKGTLKRLEYAKNSLEDECNNLKNCYNNIDKEFSDAVISAQKKAEDTEDAFSSAWSRRRKGCITFIILGLVFSAIVAWLVIRGIIPSFQRVVGEGITPENALHYGIIEVYLVIAVMFGGAALFFLIFGIVRIAPHKRSIVTLDEHLSQINDIKNLSKELLDSKRSSFSKDRINELVDRYEEYLNEARELVSKYQDFVRKNINIYIPNITDEELDRVYTCMYEGSVTSYTEAILKAKDDIKHEEEQRAQEKFKAELLASQLRTEAYTKEAAQNSRRQADAAERQAEAARRQQEIAQRQLEVARQEASDAARYRSEQARKLDKEIAKNDRDRQEWRDRMNRS